MTWLAPIGFLGLLGVVALIVIYLIRPNYQQKMISSTYVWQLSLKYRKKRIPLSKLNNILTFLCQLLILTICGLLLAAPVLETEERGDDSERIIIIDASADMLMKSSGQTRFERAVSEVKTFTDGLFDDGVTVSVILADDTPEFVVQRATALNREDTVAALDGLLADGGKCSYAAADMEGAVALAEEVLVYNPEAQMYLYTATEYLEKNGINVVDVSNENDWNAAVLNCTAEYNDDNHYEITVDLGCFGRTDLLTVYCDVHGANGNNVVKTVSRTEFFDPTEERRKVVFTTDDFNGEHLYSFDYLEVYVAVDDSMTDDNSFFLYGGSKPTIKVQYASSVPNNYFGGVIRTIREMMKDKWNVEFKALKADEAAATEGFDLYIYEHRMPKVMPTDGVVLLVDPTSDSEGSGILFGQQYGVNSESTLADGAPHDLTKYVDFSRITIAKYTGIEYQDGFDELAYYNGSPVILAKNDGGAKIVVWAFDLNYSNLPAMPDFSFLMYSLFNYYIPSTLSGSSYEIGDVVELVARGTDLKVSGNGIEQSFPEGYGEITVQKPGTYTATQRPMVGDHLIVDTFFVKIPESESNITAAVNALPLADADAEERIEFEDLIFYFAIALVTLMFVEWWLHTRKNY